VVVIANFANRRHLGYTIGLPRAGIWRVRLNSDARKYDDGFGDDWCPDVVAAEMRAGSNVVDGMPCWGNVTLAPYAVLILSQD
jgi:1,4-alpha-glucan branching enzyme